ncbi:hypothetical protein ACHAXR_013133 [Thalassiosira sp. AJA248-18]
MRSSNFAAASCCIFVGSASFNIDTVQSFLTPESSLVRRRRYGQIGAIGPSSLNVLSSKPSPSAESKKAKAITSTNGDFSDLVNTESPTSEVNTSINVVDDLWANNQASTINDKDTKSMGDMELSIQELVQGGNIQDDSSDSTKWILIGGTVMVVAAAGALAVTMGNDLGIDLGLGKLISDPSASFDTILKSLETMDTQKGMIYFSSFYVLAEILAIPAVPILTASSGYLFGTLLGTATCLFSAAIAASISFVIGRTLLRGYVEKVLADNPKFKSMDRAIGKDGFKLMLLLRLSPLFPFALSNYLYGASSIRFLPYFFGTALGFAPGTFAYVYAGRIGKALTMDSASSEPWYVYVGGMAVLLGLLKIAGDVATGVIDAMEEEDGDEGGWEGDIEI